MANGSTYLFMDCAGGLFVCRESYTGSCNTYRRLAFCAENLKLSPAMIFLNSPLVDMMIGIRYTDDN